MKQAFSILLVFIMLFTFVACGNTQSQAANTPTDSTGQTATTGSTEDTTENENTTENTAELPTNEAPAVKPPVNETPVVEAPVVQTPVVETPVVEAPVIQTPVVETPVNNTPAVTPNSTATPPAVSIVKPVTNAVHNALSESEYYQYANMNAQDKALYTAILSGLKGMQNFIDIQAFGVDYNTPPVILKRVLADHPELFYVIGNTITTYQDSDKKAINLVVRYTDGTDIDVISDDCKNVIRTANREKIAGQISAFQKKTDDFIQTVPANVKDYEKEKLIHDFICDTVSYDEVAANTYNPNSGAISQSYNAYGALVQGKAVCEGYAELFQHLCYQVGINATQVVGTGNGDAHMWNTAKIQGAWYEVDVTWNDTYVKQMTTHVFYNQTAAFFAKDHQITDSVLSVPSCNSTDYSFQKLYAMDASDATRAPLRLAEVVTAAERDTAVKYIVLYCPGGAPSQEYMLQHFYQNDSTFLQAINSYQFNLKIQNSYLLFDQYVYIPIVGRA